MRNKALDALGRGGDSNGSDRGGSGSTSKISHKLKYPLWDWKAASHFFLHPSKPFTPMRLHSFLITGQHWHCPPPQILQCRCTSRQCLWTSKCSHPCFCTLPHTNRATLGRLPTAWCGRTSRQGRWRSTASRAAAAGGKKRAHVSMGNVCGCGTKTMQMSVCDISKGVAHLCGHSQQRLLVEGGGGGRRRA